MVDSTNEDIEMFLKKESGKTFNLKTDPLFRFFLVKSKGDEYYLFLLTHHIISDGSSYALLFKEWSSLYNALIENSEQQITELSSTYIQFSTKQRNNINSLEAEEQKNYWLKKLAEPREILKLPTDYPRSEKANYQACCLGKSLSTSLSNKIRYFTQKENTSIFKFVLAVFDILLYRITNQEDQFIGFPGSGRRKSIELQNMVGMFVTTMIHRVEINKDMHLRNLLELVNADVKGSVANEDYPFQKIVEMLNVKRDLSRNPIFQVFINSFVTGDQYLSLKDVQSEDISSKLISRGTNFDLELFVRPLDQIRFELIFNKLLFNENRIEFLFEQLEYLIVQIMENPGLTIGEYSLVTERMTHVLPDPNAVLKERVGKTIIDDFNKQAGLHPDKIAIADLQETWTYVQLSCVSNRIANYLHDKQIGSGDIVAIVARKSAALVCSMLGIIKSGAAFLIVDPSYPPSRIFHYFKDAKPKLCMLIDGIDVKKDIQDYIQQSFESIVLPNYFKEISQLLNQYQESLPGITIDANSMLYAIYTSGSTGLPKGITGIHSPVVNFIEWQIKEFNLDQHENVSMLSGLAHDPLLRDIFLPLSIGATLHIPGPELFFKPKDFLEWLLMNEISIIHYTPAMGEILTSEINENKQVPCLRYAFSGGDILSTSLTKKMKRIFPNCKCVNFYGATETPQAMGYCVVDENVTGLKVPVGKGINNSQILVLNDGRKMAGIGELGEIYIRSPHLSKGYLNDQGLTEKKFISNPFANNPNDKIYRTGDLGRFLPNGMVEFLGRRDFQVKIRGFRVELGEIEAVLLRNKELKDVIVILREDNPGNAMLVAYFVPQRSADIKIQKLQNYMKNILPDYMLPAFYVELSDIPLTPNGKINRNALPKPERTANEDSYLEPQSDAELQVAELFKEILKIEKVGVFDNFFDRGGNSLLAVQLIQKIEKKFGKEIPLIALFQNPTVIALAAICTGENTVQNSVVEAIKSSGDQSPIFYIGSTLVARKCSQFWQHQRPVYAINILASNALFQTYDGFSIVILAAKYVDEILAINSDGPFYIWAYCLDQIVAYEVCQELSRRGKKIGALIFIDFARLGYEYSFGEGFKKFGLRYLHTQIRIMMHKVYYKFIGEITEFNIQRDRTFYDEYYMPACIEYKPGSLACPVLFIRSMEFRYAPLPPYIKEIVGQIKSINMPYLHLPMYRKEDALKRIVKISSTFINNLENSIKV